MTDDAVADGAARACPNCGAPAPDRYCPRCGQKQVARLVSTRRMLAELLEENFSLESRLPRTLGSLLFRPGFLTREYQRGRIARYITPLRLYIVSSLLFFLVLSLVADFDRLWGTLRQPVEEAPEERYVLMNLPLDLERTPGPLKPAARALLRQQEKVNALERREGLRVMYDATLAAVPPVIFVLVPFFALILKALYRRRLFVEHAIFVLHLHSLGFLLAALALAIRSRWLLIVLALWLAAWLFLALRRMHGENETSARTLLKYLALVVSYWIAFGLTITVVLLAAVMSV